MSRKLRIVAGISALLAALATGFLAPAGWAKKGVIGGGGANPSEGIVDPGGDFRYTALETGDGSLIAKIATDGGEIEALERLGSSLVVPAVAIDGTAGGISGDGEVLVLSQADFYFPQRPSEFTVLDTERLRILEQITLPGSFSFDAISPDGGSLYLIEYTSRRDPTEYRVREYDLDRGRLLDRPILDPDESGEEMYGWAATRAMSPDSRWAYTLYQTPDGHHPPFIHALDTERGTAVCIDLEPLADDRDLVARMALEPSPDGGALAVTHSGESLAHVDLATFEVSDPASPSSPGSTSDAGESGPPWALIVAGGGGLLIIAGSLLAVRRRPRRAGEAELELLAGDEPEQAIEREREREPVG